MAKGSAAAAAVAMLTLALVVMLPPQVSSHRYIVGSVNGWTTNVDYIIWSRSNRFYLGDWLFFVYDDSNKKMNVLEVNKTDYKKCNSDHPLHNWTTGAGIDVVPLNVTKAYYFISANIGFCNKGMKVAIHVVNPLPPPSSSSPSPSKSSPPSPSPIPQRGNVSSAARPPPLFSPKLSPLGSPAPHPGGAGDLTKDGGPEAQKSDSSSTLVPSRIFIASIIAVGAVWDLFLVHGKSICIGCS